MKKNTWRVLITALALLMVGLALPLMSPSAPIARADGVPFLRGDVFAGIGAGKVNHHLPDSIGTLRDVLNTGANSIEQTGMCFDALGSLHTTNFDASSMSRFNNLGHRTAFPFAGPFDTGS